MDLNVLTKEQFDLVYDQLKINPIIDKEFLFDAYETAMGGAEELLKSNVLGKVVPVNSVQLILYLANETGFYMDVKGIDAKAISNDETAFSKIVSVSLDKYFTNEHLNFKNEKFISKYSPIISTLDIYLNFILGVLGRYEKRNPSETLILDFIYKGFSIAKAISELIVDGFETEAFSTWRTLHENESILTVLYKFGKPVQDCYLKHMSYALAFRGGAGKSKEEIDKIFEQIKSEMKALDLKSKDMKKFIEYGWLTAVPKYNEVENFKFNFRDGVEKIAELSMYSNVYEMSSEIAHSSPLLIYSRKDYYFHLSILILYESFFRLEKMFTEMYLKVASKEESSRFIMMRNVYYASLNEIYQREKEVFKKVNTPKTK